MFCWLDKFTQCLSPFFHYRALVRTPPPAPFLTSYVDLIEWADGLVRHSQQARMTCLGHSCCPRVSGPCWATVWPSIGVQQINLK